MEWTIEDPAALRSELWRTLGRATVDRRSPWRAPVVATQSAWGPEARTVILRRADPSERRLCFHTDARSDKAGQLESNPRILWVFWDPRAQVQLRVRATATLHRGDAVARAEWEKQSPAARALFEGTGRPGAPLSDSCTVPDPFIWVETIAHHFDWLWLTRPEHMRFRFDLDAGEGQRVVP